MPAFAYVMAMPPPIVPAPTTAARAISRAGVSFGTSGILPTSRSAKNRWRIAFDSTDRTQSANSSISRREPASKSMVRQAFDGIHRGERRACAARRLAERRARGLAGGDARGAIADPVLQIAGAAALSRRRHALLAKAMAPSSRSPSITASTMPASTARAAAIGLPSVHISSASAGPHKRGSRCVPPAPGMIPRCTSG